MGVSKNRGTPKWMVYFMENPMNKWMIWGVFPPIFGNTRGPCDCWGFGGSQGLAPWLLTGALLIISLLTLRIMRGPCYIYIEGVWMCLDCRVFVGSPFTTSDLRSWLILREGAIPIEPLPKNHPSPTRWGLQIPMKRPWGIHRLHRKSCHVGGLGWVGLFLV